MANMTTQEILQGIKDWAAPKVIYDISAAHNNTKYTDLSDALGTDGGNIPQEYRKGGITVRYVQSSDNKYVQYYLTTKDWSVNVNDWEITTQKVDIKIGFNLVDPSKFLVGKAINAKGNIGTNTELSLSDYIPVDGKDIISNGYVAYYWPMAVYDVDKQLLRIINNTQQYTYQDGDTYIRLNFLNTETQPRANYGTTLTDYMAYNPVGGYLSEYATKGYVDSNINGVNSNLSKVNSNTSYVVCDSATVTQNKYVVCADYVLSTKVRLLVKFLHGNMVDDANLNINNTGTKPLYYNGQRASVINAWAANEVCDVYYDGTNYYATKHDYSEEINNHEKSIIKNTYGKVDIASFNLINKEAVTKGKALSVLGSNPPGVIGNVETLCISDYIPVNGKDVISNGYFSQYWGGCVYDSYLKAIRKLTTEQYTYQEGDAYIRLTFSVDDNPQANYGTTLEDYSEYNPVGEYISHLDDDTIEVADGTQVAFGTYSSELKASPIISDSSKYYIGSKKIARNRVEDNTSLPIVAINHDDIPISDFYAIRKIYNKYGFKASFCYIFTPFTNLADKKKRIEGISALIRDGHEIGLHAVLGKSYWIANKMFDLKPDGTSNFAPTTSELQGDNQDKTGTNIFGKTITASTKLSGAGYMNPHTDAKVVELTDAIVNENNAFFTHYGDTTILTGLDLEDNSVSKTRLQWLEYFYNSLIDSTLGYSSTKSALSDRFAEDYSVPSGGSVVDYYPDAAHLLNGKMVYWNDTSNPHYSEALVSTDANFTDDSYQLVGKFTKGLFKGCFSNANYEVIGRLLEVATAFARKFFGLNHFTDQHIHGVYHFVGFYKQNNVPFEDRNHTVVNGGNGRIYLSLYGSFVKEIDIFMSYGIKKLVQSIERLNSSIIGMTGMFYGQKGMQSPFLNTAKFPDMAFVDYLNLFGPSGNYGNEAMNYDTFVQFTLGIPNWSKYFYENAGTTQIRNGLTMYVYTHFRSCIDMIRASLGTGKIPVFSLDTISVNPAIYMAVDLLCRFCKQNGIRITSLNRAQESALQMSRDIGGNLFPNPTFNQTVARYLDSENVRSLIPDGWYMDNTYPLSSVVREKVTISGENHYSCSFTRGGYANIRTKMFGLKAGTYKLSLYTKSVNGYGTINVSRGVAGAISGQSITSIAVPTEWTLKEVNIVIPEPSHNPSTDNDMNKILDVYEDCVYYINVSVTIGSGGDTIYIANPKMVFQS